MQIPVLPRILMPAHTCTLTGCFALKGKLVTTARQSLCRALPGLIPCWFTLLATATPSVTLKLHTTFISKDHIGEAVAPVVPGKVQSLLLVDITYELAVGTSSKRPPQRCPAAKDGSKVQCISEAC